MTSPTRNAAILFADVSGSTKLYEVLGNADAQQTIDRCLGIVKRICVDQGGRVVKTIGDEVLASFPTPDAAARAAIEIQIRISAQRTSRSQGNSGLQPSRSRWKATSSAIRSTSRRE